MCCSNDCILYVLALLFPPLPVWVKRGLCSADSLINLALCCLGILPGLFHSWYIIASTPDTYDEVHSQRDVEGQRRPLVHGDGRDGNVRYVYVMQGDRQQRVAQGGKQGAVSGPSGGYGAIEGSSAARQGQASGGNQVAPPAYTDAIKGDNKVQKP